MPLVSDTWQKIPGTVDSWIYPLFLKPDVTCSNVSLIRSGTDLLLIDSGARPDIMDRVLTELKQIPAFPGEPVGLIFTHVHYDHIYQGLVHPEFRTLCRPVLIAHETGAEILATGDQERSFARMMGQEIPVAGTDLILYYKQAGPGTRVAPGPGGREVVISREIREGQSGTTVSIESFILQGGDRIEFWHTPGHTEDSISIRIGDTLHIGDTLFAANPGVAGIPGWNPDHLLQTVRNLSWLIESEGISECIPGHGNSLNRETTGKILRKVERDIVAMPRIATFDRERLDLSMWHATDLIEEAHRLFPIIGGRILFLIYQLGEIGEEEEAGRIEALFPDEEIDRCIGDFDQFFEDFLAGNKKEVQVVLKALQILQKIERVIPDSLDQFLDPALLRRAVRLCQDFLCTIQGTCPVRDLSPTDIADLIESFIEARHSAGISDDAFLASADEEETFRIALIKRLCTVPHQGEMLITCSRRGNFPPVMADPERLSDLLHAIADICQAAGSTAIMVHIDNRPEGILLELLIGDPGDEHTPSEIRIPRSLMREIEACGGVPDILPVSGNTILRAFFPPSVSSPGSGSG